ncbi:ABC transporter substrate-binding protein [Methylobacterium indicum]|uniref:sulfonate ABC transporter substrate-binding protein n=1 Tax=Methylobacterium indicum TaxID=1775910 RepID=UPI000733E017|nr:sulfonate ABC transporter substrate-binding protein [Methylobacterium indicum]KTS37874.1 ABC transporter substrate-binding protein [Methylobacterium indicum]KTS41051.1 ABC transporter substrate-binding protein [Methylobacterium indicum]KTS50733.1 ABC transporter substrate-binding protein [Methylobacterium indicum]
MTLTRRSFATGTAATLAALATGSPARADRVLRVGYQKYGTMLLLKARGSLDTALKPLGFRAEWREFPGGPQLLEALNAKAVDIGVVGETPPIFAQGAGAPLVYLAHEPPAPKSEAIVVRKDSPIRSVADLKGKKVALNKGSNVHYLLVRALEEAGLAYTDIQPVFLAPADGRAAFDGGSVDAWVIWDPFLPAVEVSSGARILQDATGLAANHQFYVGERSFTESQPQVIDAVLAAIAVVDRETNGVQDQQASAAAARELSPAVGMPVPILAKALARQSWGVAPLGPEVIAGQQRIADTFLRLGLLPRPIQVADAVRQARS